MKKGAGMKKNAFTIIELMIVVAIIGFLSMISIPSFKRFLAQAKRAEAYMNLHSIYAAQKAHWAEHGTYSTTLNGSGGVGWQPEGYKGGGKQEKFYYTYGFAQGSEGTSYFTGKLGTSSSHLSQSKAGEQEFLAVAAGDIDGDGEPDILAVDQDNAIVILRDDLA